MFYPIFYVALNKFTTLFIIYVIKCKDEITHYLVMKSLTVYFLLSRVWVIKFKALEPLVVLK